MLNSKPMKTSLSEFSRWALETSRTADERYMIWLICETTRYVDFGFRAKENPNAKLRQTPWEYYKELCLNPGLIPPFSEEDTELAARMIPHTKKFPHYIPSGHDTRPIRDLGALRFFTALEELQLCITEVSDISPLRALTGLKSLMLHSGELTDLSPLAACTSLRSLSLCLTGATYPAFAPPLFWLDASPLAALQELESLALHTNAALLSGMSFPKLHTATLSCSNTVQRDCAFLPDMPALRHLKLDGVQSLAGISRFADLRSLDISGPLRDWGDIAALPKLKCLDVTTQCGWPRDVTPLAAAPELRWVRFTGEMPRNYWPLTGAAKLCELEVNGAKTVELDVQAINTALTPWDVVFAQKPPRPIPPLRFVSADTRLLPRLPETPHPDCLESPVLFLRELRWMFRKATKAVEDLMGDEYAPCRSDFPGSHYVQRYISTCITTMEAAQRLPEVLDALRRAMAESPHEWHFGFTIQLRVPRHKWGPDRQRWWDKLEEERNRDDDDDSGVNKWRLRQSHLIESNFRLRTAEEEGEAPDPEDLRPPEEIRPQPYRPPVVVTTDPADQKEKDFALKPFDEQEQNDDDDNGEGGTSVDTNDDPPDWFWEDPEGHPLADTYRIYGLLTMDTFYVWRNLTGTAESLMGRKVDDHLLVEEQGPQ